MDKIIDTLTVNEQTNSIQYYWITSSRAKTIVCFGFSQTIWLGYLFHQNRYTKLTVVLERFPPEFHIQTEYFMKIHWKLRKFPFNTRYSTLAEYSLFISEFLHRNNLIASILSKPNASHNLQLNAWRLQHFLSTKNQNGTNAN